MPNYMERIALHALFTLVALPAAGQAPDSTTDQQPRPSEVRAPSASPDETSVASDEGAHDKIPASRKHSDEWEFTLSPYLWTMSLRSELDAGPVSATSEACFSDLLKDLDGAAQLRFEGMKDRWGFFLDGTYLGLSDDARVRAGPFRVRGIDVDVDITEAWLDFGGIYRFGEPGCTFDVLAGGRWAYIATDVSLGPFDLDNSEDYLTPVVGGRIEYALSEAWLFSFKADVGGFGVDDGADLTWGVTGLLGYRLSEHTTVGFGYRYYDIDFDGGRIDADLQYHGPIVGLAYSF